MKNWKELREELFEETLKEQAWAKDCDGKFIPYLGDIEVGKKMPSQELAIAWAKEVQMISLADHAAFIVGEGNEYRGVVAKFSAHGN